MAEPLDIIVTEKGAVGVKRNIDAIGAAGTKALQAIDLLNNALGRLNFSGRATDATKYSSAVSEASKQTKALTTSTNNLNKSTSQYAASAKNASSSTLSWRSALATLGIAFSIQQFTLLADTSTRVSNSLHIATQNSEQYAVANKAVYDSALATGQPVDALAQLYSKVSIASEALKLSQDKVATITNEVAKILTIQGSTSEQASGSLLQLSQAFSTGVVHAEEFNSVMEGLPFLAREVASQFGLTAGELKQFVVTGQLSSAQLAQAVLNSASAVDAAFGQTRRTIGQSVTNIQTSLIQLLGTFEQQTGAFQGVATALSFVAQNLNTIIPVVVLFGGAWATVTTAINLANLAMNATPLGIFITALGAAATAIIYLWNNVQGFRDAVIELVQWINSLAQALFGVDSAVAQVSDTLEKSATSADRLTRASLTLNSAVNSVGNAAQSSSEKVEQYGRFIEDGYNQTITAAQYYKNLEAITIDVGSAHSQAAPQIDNYTNSLYQSANAADSATSSYSAAASAARDVANAADNAARKYQGGKQGTFSGQVAGQVGNFDPFGGGNPLLGGLIGVQNLTDAAASIVASKEFGLGAPGMSGPDAYKAIKSMQASNEQSTGNFKQILDSFLSSVRSSNSQVRVPLAANQNVQPSITIQMQIVTPSPPEFLKKPTQDQINRNIINALAKARVNG